MNMSPELLKLIKMQAAVSSGIARIIQQANKGGLAEHVDPRDFTFESSPNQIPGNLNVPVLDENGCVVDPRVSKDDCPTFDQLRARGFIPPWSPKPGSKGFVETTISGDVEVPTGGYASSTGAVLISIVIPDGYIGKLLGFGFAIENHTTNFADITIKMMISDQAEPLMTLNPFYQATFQHPIPFYLEIPPGKTLSIVAFNTGLAALDVGAIAFGFVEPSFS